MTDRTPGNRRGRLVHLALACAVGLSIAHVLHAGGGGDVLDTVDVEVSGRDTVLGTIRPAEERETFLLELPRGAKIKATAKGTGKGAPAAFVDVTDSDGVVLGSGAAKTAKTPQIVVAESGIHHIRVCGDGELDGDYKLKVKAKMPKSAKGASEADLAVDAEAEFGFGAPAGATATVTVTAAKRSGLVPTILEIIGPGDVVIPVEPPAKPGRRHVVKDVPLPECGDYAVRFRNDGDGPGGWSAKVKLRSTKPAKSTIEITDDVLAGEFGGEQAVYARVVDESGGVVAPDGSDLDLLGVSVDVPAGAVTEPTLFTIAEADPFFVDDDLPEGGATFVLGPSGIDFTEDVSVTVPFDPQSYDDPGSEVQVAIQDEETGEVQVVTGTVDVEAGTVTFQTPHFSGFQAVSPKPRPLRGGFLEIEVGAGLGDGASGSLALGLTGYIGQKGPRTGNDVVRHRNRLMISFAPGTQTPQPTFSFQVDDTEDAGIAFADDQLRLLFQDGGISFERGRSPDVFLRGSFDQGAASISALVRRAKGKPTRGGLKGKWHVIVYEIAASQGSTGGGLELTTTGQRFDLDVDIDGSARASDARTWVTRAGLPGGQLGTDVSKKRPKPGTLRPSGAFAELSMQLGSAVGPAFVDLHPAVRGDLLVGLATDVAGDPRAPQRAMARLVLLVRSGSRGSEVDLSGRSRLVAIDAGFEAPAARSTVLPTVELLGLNVVHDGNGRLTARGASLFLRHGLDGSVVRTDDLVDRSATYSIEKDLTYRESAPFGDGALLRRRGLYVATLFGGDRIAIAFGLPARPEASER